MDHGETPGIATANMITAAGRTCQQGGPGGVPGFVGQVRLSMGRANFHSGGHESGDAGPDLDGIDSGFSLVLEWSRWRGMDDEGTPPKRDSRQSYTPARSSFRWRPSRAAGRRPSEDMLIGGGICEFTTRTVLSRPSGAQIAPPLGMAGS